MGWTQEARDKAAATREANKAAKMTNVELMESELQEMKAQEPDASEALETLRQQMEGNRLASDVEAQAQTFEERLVERMATPSPEFTVETLQAQQSSQQATLEERDNIARDLLRKLEEERAKVEELNKRARLSGKAFGGQPLGPVSSMMQSMRQDGTRYRNPDGSVPWGPDEVEKWVNVRDAHTNLETYRKVDQAKTQGRRLVLDSEGRVVRGHDCVLMVAKKEASGLSVAIGMKQASEAGKRGAQTADEWEVAKSRQAGFVSGGLHRMTNSDDPFPALGPNELLIG